MVSDFEHFLFNMMNVHVGGHRAQEISTTTSCERK